MSRCEDFPCCGHGGGDGPCPEVNPKTGALIWRCCDCGARLPRGATSSLCRGCLSAIARGYGGNQGGGE